MNSVRSRALFTMAALLLAFGVGIYAGVSQKDAPANAATSMVIGIGPSSSAPTGVDLTALWQAWSLLDQNFVETHASSTLPTDLQKVYGAIDGLTQSYGDPYTVFLPPKEAKQFVEDISGSFSGVGMELGARNGLLTVVSPLKDSPAAQAGVRSGDIVAAIDGTPSRTLAVDEAVQKIRGPKGTTVTLTLERAGQTLTVKIVRDTISIPVLKSYTEGGIFTIELYSFSENSPALFRQALRDYFNSGATKLILDLRGNPGGYLEAAVDMASYFLPVGESVVSEDYAGKATNVVHRSVGYNVFANKKLSMAILVDQGSASASEILAGALQQHGVGKLVGTRTFGKGSVQQLMDLPGGAELKITIAKWLTPNGTSISDGGLQPDVKADRTQDDINLGKDPQRAAAVSWLATQ